MAADRDFEGLRKEHKDLSADLRRGGILILTVLCILAISFARACRKVSGPEVKRTVCQVKELERTSRVDANISYIFDLFDTKETCEVPCITPAAGPDSSAHQTTAATVVPASPSPSSAVIENPISSGSPAQNVSPISATPESLPATESSPQKKDPTAAEKKQAADCQAQLEGNLEDSAQKWFGVKAPIPGVDISLDLRYWIFILPPLYFLSGIYLHALRKKLELLRTLGAQRLKTAKPDEITSLDRLYFEADPVYLRSPSNLATMLFVACYLFLPVYLVYRGAPFWTYWEAESLEMIIFGFLVLTLYSVSYAHLVTNKIDQEIAGITNRPLSHNWIRSLLAAAGQFIRGLASRVSPRLPLLIGSTLVLLTLFLTITQSGCEVKRYSGYQVVLGEQGADWFTAVGLFGAVSSFSWVWRVIYCVSLMLAFVVLILILVPRLYRLLSRNRFRKAVLTLAGALLFLTITDFATRVGEIPFVLITCAIITGVWFRYSLSTQLTRREKWRRRIRPALLVFVTPFLILSGMFLVQYLILIGLLVYFVGINILFFGLLQVEYLVSQEWEKLGPVVGLRADGGTEIDPLSG